MLHRRFDESLEENKLAIDLAPFEILATAHLIQLYQSEHQQDKVIEQCKRVLEMDPAHTGVYGALSHAYEAKGRMGRSHQGLGSSTGTSFNRQDWLSGQCCTHLGRLRRQELS
jgi:DNA-binding SARP family transcriptional activator